MNFPFQAVEQQFQQEMAAADREVARAERELTGFPDGTFLVRESESAAGAYSISVVSRGVVMHIRIHMRQGGWALNQQDEPKTTINDLVNSQVGKTGTVRAVGSGSRGTGQVLLVKPFPRPSQGCPVSLRLHRSRDERRAAAWRGRGRWRARR